MSAKLYGLLGGIGIGFVFAWAGLSDPVVIRDMLLLRDVHVFFVMGSAILVATVGVRLLRRQGARAWATDEAIAWTTEKPQTRHVAGSVLFGAGWSLAATCPGPVAVMIGQGRLAGLFVAAGLLVGVTLQNLWSRARAARTGPTTEISGAAGL
jgi:uncharacterized membrane protein YedE/YeeE